jgi:uncharacterized protein YaaQ
MKLIFAILRDEDTEAVSQGLIVAGFRVTRIASTGGFLRRGYTTFMVGVDDEKVDQAFKVMHEKCTPTTDPNLHRATLFVLDVARFDQI